MVETLHTLYRDPFALGHPYIQTCLPGRSVADLVSQAHYLPPNFRERGSVAVDAQIVPREMWNRVRPKEGTVVTFHSAVAGGGGEGGGKQVFALVAAIAISVLTGFVASGALAPLLGTAFGAGTLGASLLSIGVGLAGSLAIAALTSPPVVSPNGGDQPQGALRLEPSSVTGNVLEPNTPIPRVIGTRRVFPPFLTEPIIELIGQDEVVEAVYGLAGPHEITDIRLGDASIELGATDSDVELEVREGLPGEQSLTLTTRQGRTLEPQVEMSVHSVDPENPDTLEGSNPLPVFHAVTTRLAPDENWLHFNLAGLTRQDDADDPLRIPIRIRMRRRGDTEWRNLPEIHYQNATQSQVRFQVKFFWGDPFTASLPTPPANVGFVTAYKVVPAQNVAPLGEEFNADSYFSAGAGDDVYESGTQATTNVRNINLFAERVDVYLDTDEWPEGVYDIEVKRGEVFRDTLFTSSSYVYDGDILDFFGQIAAGTLPVSRDGLLDRLIMVRLINIWNEYPINLKNSALFAVQARNRQVSRLSAVCSGYVMDLPLGRGPNFQIDSTALSLWAWDDVGQQEDLDVLALIRPTAVSDESEPHSLGLMVRGQSSGAGTEDGYYVHLGNLNPGNGAKDGLILAKYVNGTREVMDQVGFKWDLNLNYFFRVNVEGTVIRAKAWPASLPEPTDWNITDNDGDVTGAGYVGYFWSSSLSRNSSNWFSVGLNGVKASSPTSIEPELATDFSEQTLDSDLSDWTSRFTAGSTSEVSESEKFPYNGNEEDWEVLRKTSNPGAHFRDVLTGSLNFDPLPYELLDIDGVIDWRRRCAESDFTCNMVVEGLEISDLLRVVTSTGFGRLYRSELWGVIIDKSREFESPIQIFSPRNSNSLSWSKAFARLPAGFRINFREEDNQYDQDQIIVYRAGSEGSGNRLEQVTYDGIVNRRASIQRARFDLRQAEERATFYSFTAPAESLVCRRGSLIGLNHDVLTRHFGYARIDEVLVDDGLVTGFYLDAAVEVKNEPDMLKTADVLDVEDMLDVGLQSGVAIRRTNGQITTHAVSSVTGLRDLIELENPVPHIFHGGSLFDPHSVALVDQGCLIVTGLLGAEYKRLVVSEILSQANLEANLICVDEASQIFTNVFSATNQIDSIPEVLEDANVGSIMLASGEMSSGLEADGGGVPQTLEGSMQIDATDEQMNIASLSSSSPNRRTFTVSVWAFHATIGNAYPLFAPAWYHAVSEGITDVFFDGDVDFDDFLFSTFADAESSPEAFEIAEGSFTRNQWRHYVARIDTTLATAADRLRLYRDNVLLTPTGGIVNPSQNYETFAFTNGSRVLFGHDSAIFGGGAVNKIVRFADLVVVEGQSLAPSAFGYDNGGTWSWMNYAGTYGDHGFRLNPADSGELGQDKSGNGFNFVNSGVTFNADKPPE